MIKCVALVDKNNLRVNNILYMGPACSDPDNILSKYHVIEVDDIDVASHYDLYDEKSKRFIRYKGG